MAIAPITPVRGVPLADAARSVGASSGDFRESLSAALQSAETMRNDASDSMSRFLSGENEELHSTILAAQRAELSFDLFLQVRNKVVNAYQEIMRMPL